MNNSIWSATDIRLDADFTLTKADTHKFAVHFATYRENIWFRQTWDERLAAIGDDAPCYWIRQNNQRVGGVCLKPNALWAFFVEPPFVDVYLILKRLKAFLLSVSDSSKPIEAYGILPYQSEHFLRLGFRPTETRRVMIRPTEAFSSATLRGFSVERPAPHMCEEIAELLHHAYSGLDGIGAASVNTIEEKRKDVAYYFANNLSDTLLNAASVVYDSTRRKMISACLISLWEGLPLVYEIVVLPEYRRKQMATTLLKKALTSLERHYDVMRLFVTQGNAAESVYYHLGFLPGTEQTTFALHTTLNEP
ncbi:GNAT family N-acetyltransferase [Alicyclobacillus fodiniaquatilis]|uniref:GNAT family N-acetyltransferase n=1 Tax=Alicyclobacillus fodiniaquatilis TaxID=1661150 RepID=A0ABW4JFS5_9BACL